MELSIPELLLLIGLGFVAGFINVMAGGGSSLTVPAMVLMGLPGPVANGTNRIALLAQNISSTIGFIRKGYSDWRLSLTLSLCAWPGALAGALIGAQFEGVWFNRLLACLMIVIIFLTASGQSKSTVNITPPSRARVIAVHFSMIFVGFYGGFFQIGLGFLLIAILQRGLALDLLRVNMHKVFIVGSYMVIAIIVYAVQGKINWAIGLVLAIGSASGAWVSTHLAIRKGERIIKLVLNIALVAMAIKLILS
jgi:uncharacterized membrane protein YfcA